MQFAGIERTKYNCSCKDYKNSYRLEGIYSDTDVMSSAARKASLGVKPTT
jgi:hypothetical protein